MIFDTFSTRPIPMKVGTGRVEKVSIYVKTFYVYPIPMKVGTGRVKNM